MSWCFLHDGLSLLLYFAFLSCQLYTDSLCSFVSTSLPLYFAGILGHSSWWNWWSWLDLHAHACLSSSCWQKSGLCDGHSKYLHFVVIKPFATNMFVVIVHLEYPIIKCVSWHLKTVSHCTTDVPQNFKNIFFYSVHPAEKALTKQFNFLSHHRTLLQKWWAIYPIWPLHCALLCFALWEYFFLLHIFLFTGL